MTIIRRQQSRFRLSVLAIVGLALIAVLVAGSYARAASAGARAHTASSGVFINALYANAATEPSSFGPDHGPAEYLEVANYVQQIAWSSWGGPQATGSGQVRLMTDATSTSPVTVTLGGLIACGGQSIYTTYSLSLVSGARAPKYWPKGQTGSFPCRVTAALFNPNDPSERATVAHGDCVLFNGLEVPGSNMKIPWTPQPPGGRLGPAMCATLWSGWAKPVATGRGAMRNGVRQWPAKAELRGLAWCPRQALAYTTLVMTIYGPGEPIRGKGGVSQRDAKRLRAEIDRPGLRKRSFRQSVNGCTPRI
jgi:hypothetical protein